MSDGKLDAILKQIDKKYGKGTVIKGCDYFCTECGTVVSAEDLFCRNCGVKFVKEE